MRSLRCLEQYFELSRGGASHNVRPMEGLRGFAVFLVFLVHDTTLSGPWTSTDPNLSLVADALHTLGNSGVDLFFVLSGYLIYGSLISRPLPFTKFIGRRIIRIYPAFLAVFALYVVLSFLFPNERKIPQALPEALIYLTENMLLLPGILPIEPLVTVAWSLSYEMTYYLAIPLVITLFSLRKRSLVWRICFFSCLAIAGFLAGAYFGGPLRLLMFVSGILLFEIMKWSPDTSPGSTLSLACGLLGLLSPLLPLNGHVGMAIKTACLFLTFFILCQHCFASPTAWLARQFSRTPLRWLGNMSYSYYLLHGLTLKAAFLLLEKIWPQSGYAPGYFWILLPSMFLVSLLPTTALFLAVERPLSLAPSLKISSKHARMRAP